MKPCKFFRQHNSWNTAELGVFSSLINMQKGMTPVDTTALTNVQYVWLSAVEPLEKMKR